MVSLHHLVIQIAIALTVFETFCQANPLAIGRHHQLQSQSQSENYRHQYYKHRKPMMPPSLHPSFTYDDDVDVNDDGHISDYINDVNDDDIHLQRDIIQNDGPQMAELPAEKKEMLNKVIAALLHVNPDDMKSYIEDNVQDPHVKKAILTKKVNVCHFKLCNLGRR